MRAPYSVQSLSAAMQRVADDLAAEGADWSLRMVPESGPVFGTPGMPSIEMISAAGNVGPKVWLESENTLRLTWQGATTEWWTSSRNDAVLEDILFALCSGRFDEDARFRFTIPGRAGRRTRKVQLG